MKKILILLLVSTSALSAQIGASITDSSSNSKAITLKKTSKVKVTQDSLHVTKLKPINRFTLDSINTPLKPNNRIGQNFQTTAIIED